MDLLILITLKSSGGTQLCREEDKQTQNNRNITNIWKIVCTGASTVLGCVSFLHEDKINGPRLKSKYFAEEAECVLCLYQCTFLTICRIFVVDNRFINSTAPT